MVLPELECETRATFLMFFVLYSFININPSFVVLIQPVNFKSKNLNCQKDLIRETDIIEVYDKIKNFTVDNL